jgi:hypothetical protein
MIDSRSIFGMMWIIRTSLGSRSETCMVGQGLNMVLQLLRESSAKEAAHQQQPRWRFYQPPLLRGQETASTSSSSRRHVENPCRGLSVLIEDPAAIATDGVLLSADDHVRYSAAVIPSRIQAPPTGNANPSRFRLTDAHDQSIIHRNEPYNNEDRTFFFPDLVRQDKKCFIIFVGLRGY